MINLKHYYLVAASLATLALGVAPAAKATEASSIGLSFDLSSSSSTAETTTGTVDEAIAPSNSAAEGSSDPTASEPVKPLQIPTRAGKIPKGSSDSRALAKLPPPPTVQETGAATPTPEPAPSPTAIESPPTPMTAKAPSTTAQSSSPDILSFDPGSIAAATSPSANPQPAASPPATQPASTTSLTTPADLEAIFVGNSDSLVARAVGSAEGTRTPDGGKTRAYRGHVDPGNRAWNLGTFSYQHGARSPEEADVKQLMRLRHQAQTLRQKAAAYGITMTLEEELNGIDLANQSPRAALSRGGYVDRLKQARDMGLTGSEAVLWARTRSYMDPDTGRWNAPGLGNTTSGITHDQSRRLRAIARAMEAPSVPQSNELPLDTLPGLQSPFSTSNTQPELSQPSMEATNSKQKSIVDQILSLDLPSDLSSE